MVVRWSDNSVRAHRVQLQDGALRPVWTTGQVFSDAFLSLRALDLR